MKLRDLTPLKEGIFQLEKGHGGWKPAQCETVVIRFAGSETELAPNRFDDDKDVYLPSSLEDSRLRTVEVHHEGWYIDAGLGRDKQSLERNEQIASTILDFLPEMRIGQKVMILDTDGYEAGGKIYVVKLMSVHTEASISLSEYHRELKPHTEAPVPQTSDTPEKKAKKEQEIRDNGKSRKKRWSTLF